MYCDGKRKREGRGHGSFEGRGARFCVVWPTLRGGGGGAQEVCVPQMGLSLLALFKISLFPRALSYFCFWGGWVV